jgi:hypothetical protein
MNGASLVGNGQLISLQFCSRVYPCESVQSVTSVSKSGFPIVSEGETVA